MARSQLIGSVGMYFAALIGGQMMRRIRTAMAAAVAISTMLGPAYAGSLTEQQARIAAARFVRGFGFGPNGGQVVPVRDLPAAGKSLEEIAGHFSRCAATQAIAAPSEKQRGFLYGTPKSRLRGSAVIR
jgi:hypothetical protein